MLYELMPLFLTNIIAVILIFIVLLAHAVPRSLRQSLIFTIICLLLWQDNIYVADQSIGNLVLWNTTVFIWPTCAVLSCYSFIRYLHRTQTKTREPSKLTIPIIIATAIQIFPIITFSLFNSVEKTAHGLEIDRSLGYYVYLVGLLAMITCLIFELLIRRAKSPKRSQEHQAINVVFVTVVVAVIYGITVNALIPLITGKQDFINFGVFIIDIFAVGLWLSITRERLLDIRFYAIRTVAYILSLATLVFFYALFVFVISQWLLGYDVSSLQSTVNIGLALALAFIFQPVRHFFDRFTSKIFYHDSYDNDVFYADLSRALTSVTDLRELLERAAGIVGNTLKAEQAFFFVWYGDNQYISAGTPKHSKIPIKDIDTITEYATAHDFRVILGELVDEQTPLKRLFISHKVEMILPLEMGKGQLGYLILGDQKSSGYARRDIKTFQSISDELIIAIRNALSIQEVRELNATLQQRINYATKELRASNTQLQRLDKAKDEFVSMASHQLRTPLTSVKGYISMVLDGDAGKVPNSQKKLLEEAFTSSERMVHLINDFLNVSRLQTGKFLIEKRPVDLPKVVQQELESLSTNAESRNLSFVYKLPKNFPVLDLDEDKMRQVIMNFADNAIFYSTEHSKINVNLSVEGKDVVFTVTDTGIGVPRAEQSQLFNKFYRASNARKQRPDGTGVGLFLAKKVIDVHGGKVIFESAEGKGSTFGFRLPLDELRSASDPNDLDNQNNND